MKTHFLLNDKVVCGRQTKWSNEDVYRVTCHACIARKVFGDALAVAEKAKKEAFLAQEPKRVAETWREGNIECNACQGDLFRYRGRSCMGHYNDWECANCGGVASRLTETGMSF